MKQSAKRFFSMILSLLLLAGVFVVFFDFIKPLYDDLQKVKSEKISEENFLATEKAAVKQVQDLITGLAGQSQVQQAVSLALPTEADLTGSLAQLGGLAQNSGLVMQFISISTPGVQNVSPGDQGGQKAKENLEQSLKQPIGTVNLQLRFSGSYENLKTFIQRMETNIRIFDIKTFTMKPAAKSNQDIYLYELTVATYYQQNK